MAVVILGAGALGREVLAVLEASGTSVAGFLVEPGYAASPVRGIPVADDLEAWSSDPEGSFLVAVGDSRARAKLVQQMGRVRYATAVHPAAIIGPNVTLCEGVMILGAASMTVDVKVSPHVLVYPGCTITHDCVIGAYASLGPGVSLAGGVVIEEGANIGVGAVIAPGCRIGAWSIVGAGAAVIRDVQAGSTVVGVPARPLVHRAEAAPN